MSSSWDRPPPSRLHAFATAPTAPAAGAQGAVALRIALADVISLASKHAPSGIEARIIQMLGDLTGSSTASPSQVTGSAAVSVK